MECAFNEEDERGGGGGGGRGQAEVTVGAHPCLHSAVLWCTVPTHTLYLLYTPPPSPSLSVGLSRLRLSLFFFWELCGRQITVSALHFALPRARLLIDTC